MIGYTTITSMILDALKLTGFFIGLALALGAFFALAIYGGVMVFRLLGVPLT